MSAIPSAFQLRVHGDLGVEDLRNRTALLCVLGCLGEFGFVTAGNLGLDLQMHSRDGKSGFELFERHRRRGVDGLRGHPSVAELRGESHSEASGVRGGNEFFRVRSRLRLKPGRKRIGSVLQHSAGCGEGSLTVLEAAAPMRACSSLHESILLFELSDAIIVYTG